MPGPAAPWERLADVLLQREAAMCRLVAGVPPRDFAGLYVGEEDVDRALRQLPGLDGPSLDDVRPLTDAFADQVTAARRLLAQWYATDAPGGGGPGDVLREVGHTAGLSAEEFEVLALVAAVELDRHRQRLLAYIQDSVQLPRLTLPTVARIFGPGHPGPLAVAPGSGASRGELVLFDDSGPFAARMCALAPRVAWALLGDTSPDPGLPPGTHRVARRPSDDVATGGVEPPPRLLLITGADRESRLRAARDRLRGVGAGLFVAPVPTTPQQWQALVREATVTGSAVLMEPGDSPDAELRERIERAGHLHWVLSSRGELALETVPALPWQELTLLDDRADDEDWQATFGMPAPLEQRISREQLRLVGAAAGHDPERLQVAVRRLAGGHLDGVAVRIRPRRAWEDLVLPTDQLSQLRELAVRHRLRKRVYDEWGFPPLPSTGVVALFAGPSGTGKTLAAEVVAADLGLDLYKVDLSAVVSKYIGETEKNLEKIFSAAASGDMVLFFDEADAIFGKRSEVSDAHDRYANIEVAYLLQRLEAYDGLVVMATNLQKNIDQAFLRRITIALDFAIPDEPNRQTLWRQAFPKAAPVGDLDVEFLAQRFKVTGGIIKNVALAAAFRAADEGDEVTMRHVVVAMKHEFVKLGRLRSESEFGPWYAYVCSGDDADLPSASDLASPSSSSNRRFGAALR